MADKQKIYNYTDKAIRRINAMLVVLFSSFKVAEFDELNVLESVNSLYGQIDRYVRQELMNIAEDSYDNAVNSISGKPVKKGVNNEWLLSIIGSFNTTTHYVYVNEFDRKRTRCYEALMSSKSGLEQKVLLKRSMKLLSRQIKQCCDDVMFFAMVKALNDNGIVKVKWYVFNDDKVCDDCIRLSGKIFRLKDIPPKTHIGCRCWLVPVL